MTDSTDPDDPTLSGTPPVIRFERHLGASIERVWRAVTDPDEMAAWFPARVVGRRSVGARLEFPFDADEAETFEGEVVEWSPPNVFAFTWNGDLLRFELTPSGDGTHLVFAHTIQHTTEAPRTASGWFTCLADLRAHLEGSEADPTAWASKYVEYLHTIGPPPGEVEGDHVVFERVHVATPDVIEAAFGDGAKWGCDRPSVASITTEPAPWRTNYRVRVPATDATTAARWHALLTQFDMFLSSGRLVVDDDWRRRIADYEAIFA